MPRNDLYSYFTQVGGTRLLYSAEEWVRVTVRLATAGPVSVGTREDLVPVLSGKGVLLVPGGLQEETFVVPKGQRVFIAAEAVHRVTFIVEPIPYLRQIIDVVGRGFNVLAGLLGRIARGGRGGGGGGGKSLPPVYEEKPPPCPDGLKPYQNL